MPLHRANITTKQYILAGICLAAIIIFVVAIATTVRGWRSTNAQTSPSSIRPPSTTALRGSSSAPKPEAPGEAISPSSPSSLAKACEASHTFQDFMMCALLNDASCRNVASIDNDFKVATVRQELPFEYKYGKRCVLMPSLSVLPLGWTRRQRIVLTYDIRLPPQYDSIGFLKLPGIAGVHASRGDLKRWDCQGGVECDQAFSVRLQMHTDRRLSVYYYPPKDQRASFCDNVKRHNDLSRVYTDACEDLGDYRLGFTIHSPPSNNVEPLGYLTYSETQWNQISLSVDIASDGIMSVDLRNRFQESDRIVEGRTTAKWFIGSEYAISALYAWLSYGHEPKRQPLATATQYLQVRNWNLQ